MKKKTTEKRKTKKNEKTLNAREQRRIDALYSRRKNDANVIFAQETIPYERIWPDGLMKLPDNMYSKSIRFEDINYQLASDDDQKAAFEKFCEFYNYFDSSVNVQISLISHFVNRDDWEESIDIPPADDDFNDVREEYTEMLREKFSYGNNGMQKTKVLMISIKAESEREARTKLGMIELDTINHLKVMGVSAQAMNGKQRLHVLFDIMHPDGERFDFEWKYLSESGLSTKDFIVPTSFSFGKSKQFSYGNKLGRVSYLQILAPKLDDRILKEKNLYRAEFCNAAWVQ